MKLRTLILLLVSFVLCSALSALADTVTFGLVSLSGNRTGFVTGATTAVSNGVLTVNLPNYSSFGGDSSFTGENEVDIAVTATAAGGPLFYGLAFTITGNFTGAGTASFAQTANLQNATGGLDPINNVFSGTIFLPAQTNTLNITTQLILDDGFDSAAISQVQYTPLVTPEPATMLLLGTGLCFGALKKRYRF